MPLIILTGYPCSGLSYRARQVASLLEAVQDEYFTSADPTSPGAQRYKIHVVPSHDASYPRTLYDNARTEKEARGVAYARAKRALGRDSIAILDGMNYIKGWRYQLWCEAKAAGTTCCVVHVGTPIEQCVANNEARLRRRDKKASEQTVLQANDGTTVLKREESAASEWSAEPSTQHAEDLEEPYPPELLNNLIFRYEEPSTHSRWDKPLFTVPWSDAEPPAVAIWTALTNQPLPTSSQLSVPPTSTPSLPTLIPAFASISTSETGSTTTAARSSAPLGRDGFPRRKIKPHQATVQPASTDPSTLYAFEKRTSAIVTTIRNFTLANPSAEAALAQSSDARGITIPVPDASEPVFVPAHVTAAATTDELAGAGGILALPRLQRLRRQWIGLNRAYVGWNSAAAAGKGSLKLDQVPDAFVRFLNAEFASGE